MKTSAINSIYYKQFTRAKCIGLKTKKEIVMATIRNRLNQRLIINLPEGKNIDLLAMGTADVTAKDMTSPHLQALLNKGDIVEVQTGKPHKDKPAAQPNDSTGAGSAKKSDKKQRITGGRQRNSTIKNNTNHS